MRRPVRDALVLLMLAVGLAVSAGTAPLAHAVTFPEVVLQEAAVHQGKPYVWGATGPDANDCLGLTRYVYGQLGVALPRTSAEQYAALATVTQADKQPGDLVFTFNDAGVVYHVGIYAGANQMWAAPKTGDYVRLQTIGPAQSRWLARCRRPSSSSGSSLGSQRGPLGSPTTGELCTPDGSGAYTHYQGGSIYWTTTQACEVCAARSGALGPGWVGSGLFSVNDD